GGGSDESADRETGLHVTRLAAVRAPDLLAGLDVELVVPAVLAAFADGGSLVEDVRRRAEVVVEVLHTARVELPQHLARVGVDREDPFAPDFPRLSGLRGVVAVAGTEHEDPVVRAGLLQRRRRPHVAASPPAPRGDVG